MIFYYIYKLGEFIVRHLPLSCAYKLAIFLSDLHQFFAKNDRANVTANLKAIFPEKSNKEISNELFLSVHTVESHFGNIFSKLGVYSRVEAVLEALRRSWFTLEEISPTDSSSEG